MTVATRQVHRPLGDAVIDVGEARQRPGEDGDDEGVGAAGRQDAGDVLVGHERAVQAARRRCAWRACPACPRSCRCGSPWRRAAGRRGRSWAGRRLRPHRVQAVAGPDRRQAAEHLVAGDAEAALHPLGRRGRQQDRQVVAALGVAGGEDLACHRLASGATPATCRPAPQVGGDAHPVEMHVDRQRGGRRVVGEPALLAAHSRPG